MFFGFETDTALATYLFAVIDRAVSTETATFRQLNPRLQGVPLRRASASFRHGVVARVSNRLDIMHRARDTNVRAQRSTGTDLIVAKNRVVEEAFGEIDIRLVRMAATGRRVIHLAAQARRMPFVVLTIHSVEAPGDEKLENGRFLDTVTAWEGTFCAAVPGQS